MKKYLSYTALLLALLLSACGSKNQDMTEIELNLAESGTLTEADKERQYLLYLENVLKEELQNSSSDVKNASVALNAPTDSDIASASEEEISVAVVLELQNELSAYSAEELADMLAKGVGNTSTDEITIMDTDGNLLFPEK